MGLNPQQRCAVEAPRGYVQILAGPGTGKTYTIVERIIHFINSGIPPSKILLMTFTNAAAREIKRRVENRIVNAEQLNVGTFHSTAIRMLALCGMKIKILDECDKLSLIRELIVENNSEYDLKPKQVVSAFSKNTIDPQVRMHCTSPEYPDLYKQYLTQLKSQNLYDFDMLLVEFLRILKEGICKVPYDAILVDEFQDTCMLQLEISIEMAAHHGQHNLTIVGDPDQSIYGFRHAEPRNFQNFRDMIVKDGSHSYFVYNLETNYRSTQNILSQATQIINHSADRFGKDRALRAETSVKSTPIICGFYNERREAEGIKRQIETLIRLGVKPSEIAVLGRSSRSLMHIESEISSQTSYNVKVVGGSRFVERPEIRIILDYLRVANDSKDYRAIVRSINNPKRKIGAKSIEVYFANNKSLSALSTYESVEGVGAYLALIEKLREDTVPENGPEGIRKAIKRIVDEANLDPDKLSIRLFSETVLSTDYSSDLSLILNENPTPLAAFLTNWVVTSDASINSNDAITLSTVHSAKGLEWPVVFMAGTQDSHEITDEERRVMYVAVTRAKALLVISFVAEHGLHSAFSKDAPLIARKAKRIEFEPQDYEALSHVVGREVRPRSKGFTASTDLSSMDDQEFPGFTSAENLLPQGFSNFKAPSTRKAPNSRVIASPLTAKKPAARDAAAILMGASAARGAGKTSKPAMARHADTDTSENRRPDKRPKTEKVSQASNDPFSRFRVGSANGVSKNSPRDPA